MEENRPRGVSLSITPVRITSGLRQLGSEHSSPTKLDESKPLKRGSIHPSEQDLNALEKLLQLELPDLQRDGSYSKEDKMRRERIATNDDIVRLKHMQEIPYRRIIFSKIPNELKPIYEQAEVYQACSAIMDLLDLREKYIYYDDNILQHPLDFAMRGFAPMTVCDELEAPEIEWKMQNGVITFLNGSAEINIKTISVREYYSDLQLVLKNVFDVVNKSFCHMRLKLLQSKFEMHLMCNADREQFHHKVKKTKDFYNIIKVDNHVHLSAAMNQKHLQKFMKAKLLNYPDECVYMKNGELKKTKEIFASLGITPENLTVDMLDVYADHKTFHRFDRFNSKYNPMGTPLLREIFLKTDNYLKGRFFAEITKEVINGLERENYIKSEYRVSIYGRSAQEWKLLAIWFKDFNLKSDSVKWLIQVPRLFSIYKSSGQVNCFQDMLDNIFGPVVEASLHPEDHPEIDYFLSEVVGFDSVDDESKNEKLVTYANYKEITPENWKTTENPPYSYWSYYMYANLHKINLLRKARYLNTFAFRPHCGEAGPTDHLAASFLTAHSINHGIELQSSPVLQYLFYLKQIGLSMSPLSNNKLFLKFLNNPFLKFFQRGLNVTLSTDDPLMIHLTREPLLEEYSVVAQALELSTVSLCELARNSVLQSGFSYVTKKEWIGDNFLEGSSNSNDVNKTSLSWIRYDYRFGVYKEEIGYVERHSHVTADGVYN